MIRNNPLDGLSDRGDVAEWNGKAGIAVVDHIECAFFPGRDHRSPEVHSLQEYDAESLFAARQHERLTPAIQGLKL
jgi:hypothetical protein